MSTFVLIYKVSVIGLNLGITKVIGMTDMVSPKFL